MNILKLPAFNLLDFASVLVRNILWAFNKSLCAIPDVPYVLSFKLLIYSKVSGYEIPFYLVSLSIINHPGIAAVLVKNSKKSP